MTPIDRLVANGNSIINFLKEFSSATAKDVSIDWVNDDGTVDTKTFANIKKFQDSVNLANDGGVIKNLGGEIINGRMIMVAYDGTYSLTDGDNTPYPFDKIFWSSGKAFYTLSQGKLTINESGVYLVLMRIRFTGLDDSSYGVVRLYKNGSSMARCEGSDVVSSNINIHLNEVIVASEGDEIEVYVQPHDDCSIASGGYDTQISIVKLS